MNASIPKAARPHRPVWRSGLRLGLLTLLLASAGAWADWYEATEAIMGTRVHAELWHEDAARARALLDAVMAEMQRIDAAFSPYREDSELSRINRQAGEGWVAISSELAGLLREAAEVSELTDGAFDVTYASVGRYYDFRAGKAPDDATVAAGLDAIDYRFVQLARDDSNGVEGSGNFRVRFAHPHVYVDLGGIAKGHAVDRAVELLLAAGVRQAAVSAGGDSRIVGDRRGKPWTVGVKDPRAPERMAVVIPLVDTAVSTSGDYERFFERDGVRYHHILDPATGRSAQATRSVTILGTRATLTDALSTSVFVLGPARGMALIERLPDVDAIVIDADGELHYSQGLEGL